MNALRAADVVLQRKQEVRVAGDLRDRALRSLVELPVVTKRRDEGSKSAGLRHRGHAEAELLRLLILGHCFERFDVVQPEVDHVSATPPPPIGIRAASTQGSFQMRLLPIHGPCARGGALRNMRIGDPVIYRGKRYVLRGLDPMSVPDRRADLEDSETGELIRAPFAELESALA